MWSQMSTIESKRKLAQVRYHLENLKAAQRRSDELAILSELSALQNASYSVMQRMLYDSADLLGLGFTREDYLDVERFESAAKKQDNDKALEFLSWWQEMVRELGQNPVYELRDFDTHRGNPRLEQVPASVYVSGLSAREISDPRYVGSYLPGHFGSQAYSWGPPASIAKNKEARRQFKLEVSSEVITEDSSKLLDALVAIVEEAERTYWATS